VTSGLLLQAVVSGLLLGGVYGLVACGLSLIFGVLRIINFAHGAVMMLAMYATYWLFVLAGVDPYLSVVLTAPLFFSLGVIIQKVVIEPNRFAAEHNQLLLTLGLALFFENLALVLWQGDFRTVKVSYSGASFMLGEALVEVPRLVASGGAVLMAAALFAFLRLTDVGKALRALAEEGARDVVVVPVGFVCDHVEVLYDLDVEAHATARAAGLGFARASTVNDHPLFIQMLAEVVAAAAA